MRDSRTVSSSVDARFVRARSASKVGRRSRVSASGSWTKRLVRGRRAEVAGRVDEKTWAGFTEMLGTH